MRLPTIPEIFDMGVCLIMGHDWYFNSAGKTVCKECGATK